MDVYILWHVHEMPNGEEDGKLIGVYASAEDAEAARQRVVTLPGIRDIPDGFAVDCDTVGEDHWTEGFITVIPEDLDQMFGPDDIQISPHLGRRFRPKSIR